MFSAMSDARVDRETLEQLAPLTDPHRVRRAREARSLTQAELAKAVTELTGRTLSAPAISQIERGATKPSPETLGGLAHALRYPPAFFATRFNATGRPEPDPYGFFRSLRTTSARDRRSALAHAFLVHDLVVVLERHLRLPDLDVPKHPVGRDADAGAPAAAAAMVRAAWHVPAGPIPNVVRQLERAGIAVARLTTGLRAVDAFSVNFPERPVVILGDDKGKRARSRFDAAHELGHLVMHSDATDWESVSETQAHAFAAEFLMPEQDVRDDLAADKLTWRRLVDLKVRWGTSVAALVRRARDLNVINSLEYTNWMKGISARGWRVDEPGDRELGPPEAPVILELAVERLGRMGLPFAEVVSEAGLPLDDLLPIVSASSDPRPRLDL